MVRRYILGLYTSQFKLLLPLYTSWYKQWCFLSDYDFNQKKAAQSRALLMFSFTEMQLHWLQGKYSRFTPVWYLSLVVGLCHPLLTEWCLCPPAWPREKVIGCVPAGMVCLKVLIILLIPCLAFYKLQKQHLKLLREWTMPILQIENSNPHFIDGGNQEERARCAVDPQLIFCLCAHSFACMNTWALLVC